MLKHRKRAAAADEPQSQALGDAEATQKVLDDYFGADEAQLGEGDRFLKKFIANKAGLTLMLAGSCRGLYRPAPLIRQADRIFKPVINPWILLLSVEAQMAENVHDARAHQTGPFSGHTRGWPRARLAEWGGGRPAGTVHDARAHVTGHLSGHPTGWLPCRAGWSRRREAGRAMARTMRRTRSTSSRRSGLSRRITTALRHALSPDVPAHVPTNLNGHCMTRPACAGPEPG